MIAAPDLERRWAALDAELDRLERNIARAFVALELSYDLTFRADAPRPPLPSARPPLAIRPARRGLYVIDGDLAAPRRAS